MDSIIKTIEYVLEQMTENNLNFPINTIISYLRDREKGESREDYFKYIGKIERIYWRYHKKLLAGVTYEEIKRNHMNHSNLLPFNFKFCEIDNKDELERILTDLHDFGGEEVVGHTATNILFLSATGYSVW